MFLRVKLYFFKTFPSAKGLRHCDIDLTKKTITFKAWEKVVSYEKKRGGKRREKQIRRFKSQKDERTVPISKALYKHLKDIPLIKDSDDPIWPNRYKSSDDSWGHHSVLQFGPAVWPCTPNLKK